MSLKKRRLLAGIACLFAAVCLSAGCLLLSGEESTCDTSPSTGGIQATDDHGNLYPPPVESPSPLQQYLRRWFAAALLVVGIVCSAALLVFGRLDAPFLGPDTESALLVLSLYGAAAYRAHTAVPFAIYAILAALDLILLCAIVSWLFHRLPPDWLGVHRLSDFCRRRLHRFWVYPALLFVLCILSVTGCIWGLFHAPVYGCVCLFPACAAIFCLIRVFWQTDRLLRRIHALHDGQPVPPAQGLFAQHEQLLLQWNQQREEAIRQAVAGEQFKVELIANVSHDLRTPLTAILGYSELLDKQTLSPEAAQWLTQLKQRAGYMRDLVESLFELTKVSSGVQDAKKEQIDLIRLLEQTIGIMDDALRHSGLELRRHYCAQTLLLRTDGARMHQVFANLLENAVKYALSNTRIYIDVQESPEDVQIRFTNTAAYEMDFRPEEIVQRFARGDRARTTHGSGLGLAIAQTYTESVGGAFHVQIDGDQFRAVVSLPKTAADIERDL